MSLVHHFLKFPEMLGEWKNHSWEVSGQNEKNVPLSPIDIMEKEISLFL